ncbi:ribonuclease domain-containing protein [Virgibacillus oceani]
MKRLFYVLAFLLAAILFTGCTAEGPVVEQENENKEESIQDGEIDEDGYYTAKEEVAIYIHNFAELPANYITKEAAYDLGWEPSEGNLWEVTDQKSIGGDRFGNREGNLPDEEGRQYYEADINYEGGYRRPERIVYSNDGLIYYTADHYDTFTLLYGDD